MIVSRGIGNSIFPFRVNNRPEIILIELHGLSLTFCPFFAELLQSTTTSRAAYGAILWRKTAAAINLLRLPFSLIAFYFFPRLSSSVRKLPEQRI